MNNPNYNFLEVPNNLIGYITDKPKSAKSYFKYLLSRTQMMFKYTNLPETIDPMILERMLQVNGVACITDATIDSESPSLYCFSGNLGGELDEYYRPTKFVVSNPHLGSDGFFKECIVNGTEPHTGVLMYNDTEWQGLTALIARYASLMTENVLTVRVADIMLRKMDIIIAGTDKAKKSADLFLKKLENGDLAAMSDSAFMESIRTLPVSNYNGSYMIQFIELQQYLKGSFYNELGLRANYNMKREAIGEGESTLDADSVLPLCENMLSCRRKTIALVNQLYGTNISVDYNSAWLENHIDSYLSIYNKIAESVSAMNAEDRADAMVNQQNFGSQGGEIGEGAAGASQGQPGADGTEGKEGVKGDEGKEADKETLAGNRDQKDGNENSGTEGGKDGEASRRTSDENEINGQNSEENMLDTGRDAGEDRAGEDRAESGSGVGRGLEGTGQDEELIELEEVVEKMIDKVYDQVVNGEGEVGEVGEGDKVPDGQGSSDGQPAGEGKEVDKGGEDND